MNLSEQELIALWTEELELNKWAEEILGQPMSGNLNSELAKKAMSWSEKHVSLLITEKVGKYLHHVSATRTWYAWNGRIHQPLDSDVLVVFLIMKFHEQFTLALAYIEDNISKRSLVTTSALTDALTAEKDNSSDTDPNYAKEFNRQRSFRDYLASSRGINAVISLIRANCETPQVAFEEDQAYFVCRNFVFLLDELRNPKSEKPWVDFHSPDRLVTRYFDADYQAFTDEEVENSAFMHYLRSSLRESDTQDEIIEFLQTVMGASFMGTSKLKTILNITGPPNSGKSIFIELFHRLGDNGSRYCAMASAEAIKKNDSTNFAQDEFRSKRHITISEPDTSDKIDNDFLKTFTGDSMITTRTLNAKSSSWTPQGILTIASNAVLKIDFKDQAIKERVKIIEFPYSFVTNPQGPFERQRIDDLMERLTTDRERSIILYWVVQGMSKFANNNLRIDTPDQITELQGRLFMHQSQAERWIEEYTESGYIYIVPPEEAHTYKDNAYLTTQEAYDLFRLWASSSGERRTASKRFFLDDLSNTMEIFNYGRTKRIRYLMKANSKTSNDTTSIPARMQVINDTETIDA